MRAIRYLSWSIAYFTPALYLSSKAFSCFAMAIVFSGFQHLNFGLLVFFGG